MEKLIQEFTAVDQNGKEYRLQVYQVDVPVRARADPSAAAGGQKRIVTEDGKPVNHLKRGEYEIVATGVILRTSNPDAP